MSVKLLVAPAAAGKTAYVLNLVREAARDLGATPRVVVPSHLQVRSWRRRLAAAGGAMGVRTLTFDRLYAECLNAAGEVYTELSEPVQYRLLHTVIDGLVLDHYAPLGDRPGFMQLLQGLTGELKAGMILPETFSQAVGALGGEARLNELAQIYGTYQLCLQERRWADRAGLGWLAVEALAKRAPEVGRDWPLLVVDGFDNLTPVQIELIRILAQRAGQTIITLTAADDERQRPLAHRRFRQTRHRLEAALGVTAESLPVRDVRHAPVLSHLEANLFESQDNPCDGQEAVELVEAPDRSGEVRAAMRWLKARLVHDEMSPGEVALMARSVPAYRPFILQTAAEFGLPIRLVDGLPLRSNPAVAAILDLLRLMLPRAIDGREPQLPRRLVVEAWRSPYFDWNAWVAEGEPEPIGIVPRDADHLDAVARWGRVIGGLGQWQEVLDHLGRTESRDEAASGGQDEERGRPSTIPSAAVASELAAKFQRFVARLTPPAGLQTYRSFVGWLESLIGPDPQFQTFTQEPAALQIVARARAGSEINAEQDVAALQQLKDVLRGLVWAEEALATAPVAFDRFFSELVGAVEANTYRMPVRADQEEILVADVVQARGIPFRAVALVGMAEGEFPTSLTEDPLLRDADRQRLASEFDLPLEPSTESAEAEFFYEAITRPRERLLLVRPRLADNGAPWQASPFWEEVRRLVEVGPVQLLSESVPTPDRVASWPELMESLASHTGFQAVRDWIRAQVPARQENLENAVQLLRWRQRSAVRSPYDGDLSRLAETFARRFGPDHVWSASRLERYRSCAFSFFVASALRVEPRQEPVEGLDARQLGNIYHRILEQLYKVAGGVDLSDLGQLLSALDTIAAPILDQAPAREGFRETAWWQQTRSEILVNLRRTLAALAELPGDFAPHRQELLFGIGVQPPLVLRGRDDQLQLRGAVDRVDRDPDGRLRVIDYKIGGPSPYTDKAITEGEKLQLPLYALAVRDALGLGELADGFYWHVRHAQASKFTLGSYGDDPDEALMVTVQHAWEAVQGARAGDFVPQPPAGGCPSYCPAASFCWHFRAGFGG